MRASKLRLLAAVVIAFVVPACGGGGGGGGGGSGAGTPAGPPAPVDAPFTLLQQANDFVTVCAVALDGSNDLYVGGNFTQYNRTGAQRLVRLNQDGTVDEAFDVGGGFNDTPVALAPVSGPGGGIYVGGPFTQLAGVFVNCLVRLNADGSRDTAFITGTGFGGAILALASDGAGGAYVAGAFTSYSGTLRGRIVRVLPSGAVNAAFAAGTGFNGNVESLYVAPDGDIYVGGDFTAYNGTAVNRLVRLNANGTIDATWTGTGANGTVTTLAEAPGGDVYAGGNFTTYNGTATSRFVRINANGTIDTAAPGNGFDAQVECAVAALDSSGDVYVAGAFGAYNSGPGFHFVRLNSNLTIDTAFDTGNFPDGFETIVRTVAPATDGSGDVYAGGDFTYYANTGANRLARLNPDATPDEGFAAAAGGNADAYAIAPARDGSGDVYVGGSLWRYDGAPIGGLARLNADGTLDAAFDTGTGFNGTLLAVVTLEDGSGDVCVGGDFTTYNGLPAARFARLNSDGSLEAVPTGTGFNNVVNSLAPALDGSGDIYASGMFTGYNGTSASRIIRLNANATRDSSFVVGAGFNDVAWSVAAAQDLSGDVYVGGQFTAYNGIAAPGIARLNSDGSRDTAFEIGTGITGGSLSAIAAATDGSGDLYACGSFSFFNGVIAGGIVRVNPDGTRDTAFATGTGFNNTVDALAVATDGSGDVYAAGAFTTFAGAPVSLDVARINPNGTLDTAFVTGPAFTTMFGGAAVYALAPAIDGFGDLYVGGPFVAYQTATIGHVIALNPDGSID